ncbi:MAG: small multi-drug export protein [Candidatus Omnitrophica bacterium]|nr:small multi-drug export protein [Candidatus Omnitrophota bacterium]
MLERIVDFMNGLPKEFVTVIVAALPVSELRGAIPLAIAMKQPLVKTLILAYIGNMLPVIPLLVLLGPVSEKLRHIPALERFFNWLFERTKRKAEIVQRYEALGLILFVAIPLPATGAWTGCIAASLFKVKFKYAFPAILIGVLIAGVIVTSLTLMGIKFIDTSYVIR